MIQIISETELILNPDGSVYHLNLLANDLADTIIFVGDPERVPLVSKYFDSIELVKGKREFITHTGYINGKRISVLSTGIGTDNIDIVLNEIDILSNIDLKTREVKTNKAPKFIYRIGTSGALQANIEVDSILVSTHAIGLDGLMNYYISDRDIETENNISEQLNYSFINPYFVNSSNLLLQKFDDTFLRGVTATCCGFYAPQGRMIRKNIVTNDLINKLTNIKLAIHEGGNRASEVGNNYINKLRITNFEMETAAIYGLSNLFGFQAVSVNAIMANRITHTFSKQANKTMENTILKTLEIICN